MPLYPKNRRPFSKNEFANPGSEYRGCPFWCWNTKLDREQLLRQLGYFGEMGMGGPTIHCRTGLATPYLGKDFMDAVRACTDAARKKGMLTWLYDEDRWPSGFAGGLVTKDKKFRIRHLLFTPRPYSGKDLNMPNISGAFSGRTENGTLVAAYDVVAGQNGRLASYTRVPLKSATTSKPARGARRWYAYLETAAPTAWFNFQTYVDTLNPAAIERFIETTHEVYKKAVGKDFGKAVPAMFTDEPQFARKGMLPDGSSDRDVMIPWTGDLPKTYKAAYGADLLDTLPEVFWLPSGGGVSVARYRYHDHIAERFSSAFADTIGDWCTRNNIALTGHMMEEPTLSSQTHSLGEAMRSYRAFHLPGIDMLCDWHEYTTAKQTQSAVHQYGREGMLSELYGVTGWHFDFVGHKASGDWQAALGVTIRVHHLAWVSMAGEAKRDYPASIFYQSPWWREYKFIEDHFSRVNVAITRGKPVVRIGVVHPIESYWLSYGPSRETEIGRDMMEARFQVITKWLLFGNLDFNFIAESLLPTQSPRVIEGDRPRLGVGEMGYDVIVVPGLTTIRGSTLDELEKFADAGGEVIFAGEIPQYVDAAPSDRAALLAARVRQVPFTRPEILAALEHVREVGVWPGSNGNWMEMRAADFCFLYQLRQDGDDRYLFICSTDRVVGRPNSVVSLTGTWKVTELDTLTGEERDLAAAYVDGKTNFAWACPAHGHVLVRLSPGKRAGGATLAETKFDRACTLADPVPVTLSEPNVLLLDQAEWRLDGGAWQSREEILILDNLARKALGMREREGHIAQPWVDQRPDPVKGLHELILKIPMRRKVNVEWVHLLGDFGVRVSGRHATITAPVRRLTWGDWVHQGLPFYGGNVTYHVPHDFGAKSERLTLRAEKFKAPLLTVDVAGERIGPIALAPFDVQLPALKGAQTIDITAYGNRNNAVGPVHCSNERLVWWGSNAWRTTDEHYAYEYQLRPMGVLAAPVLLRPRR